MAANRRLPLNCVLLRHAAERPHPFVKKNIIEMTSLSSPVSLAKQTGTAQWLRRSRSLAVMLPSLLLTGVITLIVTAVMCIMWNAPAGGFFGAWMESWLTAWPIAFPVTYLIAPSVNRLAARISAPAREDAAMNKPVAGLWFDDIVDVSTRATVKSGTFVRRNLRDPYSLM